MTTPATETLIEHLREARELEQGTASLLEGHLRGAPPGPYRTAVRRHLDETRRHAEQLDERLTDLGAGHSPLRTGIILAETLAGRVVGLWLAPLNLVVSRTSPDTLLRQARDAIAAEAAEVAAYDALERLAEAAGDEVTASLARSLRADEEEALANFRRAVPGLADRLARDRFGGPAPSAPARPSSPASAEEPEPEPEPEPASRNGGPVTERETPYRDRAERLRETRREAAQEHGEQSTDEPTRGQVARLREAAREAETTPESPGAELNVEAPWEGYDAMTAAQVIDRLVDADDTVVAMVRLYEQTHKRRKAIIHRTGGGE